MGTQHLHLQHLHTSGSTGPETSLLYEGELAVSMSGTSTGLWTRDNDGNVVKVGRTETELKDIVVRDIAGSLSDLSTSAKTNLVDSINEVCDTVTEDELVTASALNDLNERVIIVSGDVIELNSELEASREELSNALETKVVRYDVEQTLTEEQKQQAIDNIGGASLGDINSIKKELIDDEEVVSYALNNLNSRIEELSGSVSSKVDKVSGKGLSTNDYTTEEKEKLASLEKLWESGSGEHSVQTVGTNSQALGDCSVAEGAETDAHSYASHAEGYMTSTGEDADYSHAEGYKTSTQGVASHAEGDNTVTNNPAEHAEGRYNKSNMGGTSATNTLHSIGIGNGSGSIPGGERKNAVEVMENGDQYIIGIGGYDGKDIVSASTLQEVMASTDIALNGLNTRLETVSGSVETKQETLQSGVNIKTINGNSVLGSGNIEIQGGGGVEQDYVDQHDAETLQSAKDYASGYTYSSDDIDDKLSDKANSGDVETLVEEAVVMAQGYIDSKLEEKQDVLESYIKSARVDGNTLLLTPNTGADISFTPTGGGGYVDKEYVDAQDGATLNSANTYTDEAVSGKADSSDVYAKSETDFKVTQSLTEAKEYASGYTYSKSQSDAKYALIGASYTKSEEDDLLDDKADKADVGAAIESAKTFTTQSVSGKANSADVYAKSETYTKSETDSAITSAVTSAIQGKLHFEVATSLPESGDGSTIYLIPKATGETQNQYDEYAWVNDSWELIGVASVDLSQYALKTDVDEMVGTVDSKVDTVSGSVTDLTATVEGINTNLNTVSGSLETHIEEAFESFEVLFNTTENISANVNEISGNVNTISGMVSGMSSSLSGKVDTSFLETNYLPASGISETYVTKNDLYDVEYTVAQAIAELKAQIQYLMNNR